MALRDGRQELHGRTIDVSSVDRVVFPDTGTTKGDLVAYYARIADTMFPYLAGRPVAITRYHDGIDAPGAMQKNASPHFPPWVDRVRVAKRGGGTTDHIVVGEPAVIVYLANQGAVEFHTWLARADALDAPDQLVFDLDPPGEDGRAARSATRRVRQALDELGLPSLLKTSGSKGYHVHVLVDRGAGVDVSRFAADVTALLVRRHPDELTGEFRKAERHGRVLVDHFRNRFGQTVVAPYSVRARPTAPVSTPLAWDELGAVEPRRHTVRSVFRRLGQRDDPWASAWTAAAGGGVSLVDARVRLDELLTDADG